MNPAAVATPVASTVREAFKTFINAAPQTVWAEITRTDRPITAFFNSRMHVLSLTSGSPIAMRSPDGKYTAVFGRIIDFDPPRRFSHTFRFTSSDDPECVIVYTLTPSGGGTEFVLTIENLTPGTKSAKQMISGSKFILATLKRVAETGRPSLLTRVLFGVFSLLSFTTPKRCLSEHWPLR